MLDPNSYELPPIPSKHYFNIGEVSKLCAVKQHVLRYWEQEFPQLKPIKRRGNRRSYQRHDVKLIRQISKLLYVEGFTISGARARLEQQAAEGKSNPQSGLGVDEAKLLSRLIEELNEVRDILR
ncbi:MAG: MerR family transcriptional regulator [Gammaproteobacteria bacterium]|nr:MerR family transcriptional regulator [Gammaproteobacteria bacterium]